MKQGQTIGLIFSLTAIAGAIGIFLIDKKKKSNNATSLTNSMLSNLTPSSTGKMRVVNSVNPTNSFAHRDEYEDGIPSSQDPPVPVPKPPVRP